MARWILQISFAPFASSEALESRLSAADVHIVSLRESWTGTVVPSKFFGALAIRRPVLFLGSSDSAVAKWIQELEPGWLLNECGLDSIVHKFLLLAIMWRQRRGYSGVATLYYRDNFSRNGALDRWDRILRGLIVDE